MLLVKVSVPLKPPHWLWNYVLSTIYNTQIHKYTFLLKLFKINTIPQNIYFSSVSLNEKSSRQFYFYILNVPACNIPDSSQWSTKATPRSLKSGTKIITKLWPVLTLMWFLPPVQHWLAGGGGGGMGEEGESHMGSSQAAVTWFMFAGWADWRRRSSGEKFVQEETWSLLSCGPLNKLKSSSHQTACHGNPCHQSKGEFSVCLTTMLNVLFVQCLTKTGV